MIKIIKNKQTKKHTNPKLLNGCPINMMYCITFSIKPIFFKDFKDYYNYNTIMLAINIQSKLRVFQNILQFNIYILFTMLSHYNNDIPQECA